MRWAPFLLLAWVFLGLEVGLRSAMPFGEAGVAPSFALILCVYVSMGATHGHAHWAALLLGACVDLASRRVLRGGGDVTVLGPNALGFLLACQLTLVMRGVVFRKNPLALAFLACVGGLVCAGRLNTATPKAGLVFELDVIAACFIGGASASGGVGKVMGAVIGAFVMGVMNNGMSILGIGIDYQQVIKGLVLLAAVCVDVYNKKK